MAKRRSPVALALPGLEAAMAPHARPVSPAAKALTVRAGKGRPSSRARCSVAPAPKPWECVVLAVDTAKHAGWAIGVRGQLLEYGQHDTERHPELTLRACSRASSAGIEHKLPVVLVLEAPYGGERYILVALGVAKERWLSAWRAAGEAKSRVVTVEPSVWRGPVLGSWAVGAKREVVRPHEQSVARGITRDEAIGPDAAAAVCIHHWAAHARKVGDAIGKRATKASLKAWQGGGV